MYWFLYISVVILLGKQASQASSKKSKDLSPRVYGATNLRYDVHKYLVELRAEYSHAPSSLCSGSIIQPSWILSAAHCVSEPGIYLMTANHYTGTKQLTRIATINKVFMHPLYNPAQSNWFRMSYDLSLLKTQAPMRYNKYIAPIKLSKSVPKPGDLVNIAAYGEAEQGLLKHREGFTNVDDCEAGVPHIICTLSTVRAGGGDSGGALLDKQGRLTGVVSSSCAEVEMHANCLTVYASVAANWKWINKILIQN